MAQIEEAAPGTMTAQIPAPSPAIHEWTNYVTQSCPLASLITLVAFSAVLWKWVAPQLLKAEKTLEEVQSVLEKVEAELAAQRRGDLNPPK